MAAVTGLDHCRTLPPYFPAGRGEDLLFGIMLERIHPDSLVLSEGWAIRHEPIESRVDRAKLSPLFARPGLQTLADWLGHEPRDQWGRAPETRLKTLSQEVLSLSDMQTDSLELLVSKQLASKQSSLLRQCMAHLDALAAVKETPNKSIWANFLSETQSSLVTAIQSEERTPVTSMLQQHNGADLASVRSFGARFGKAIADWPKICAAAKAFSHSS